MSVLGMLYVRRGPYVQTVTGGHWWSFSPRPEDVRLADILALRRVCRFGGHLRDEIDLYVVLEHGVRVAWLVRELGGSALECLAALHHDSHEAYPPGDQLGPVLRAMRSADACALLRLTPDAFAGLLEVERRAKVAVRVALGVQHVFECEASAKLIKHADMVLLATERRDVMAPSDVDWGSLPEPLRSPIVPWSPREAARLFLQTHEQLGGRL